MYRRIMTCRRRPPVRHRNSQRASRRCDRSGTTGEAGALEHQGPQLRWLARVVRSSSRAGSGLRRPDRRESRRARWGRTWNMQAVSRQTQLREYPLEAGDWRSHVHAMRDALATFGRGVRKAVDDATALNDADTADLFTEGLAVWTSRSGWSRRTCRTRPRRHKRPIDPFCQPVDLDRSRSVLGEGWASDPRRNRRPAREPGVRARRASWYRICCSRRCPSNAQSSEGRHGRSDSAVPD